MLSFIGVVFGMRIVPMVASLWIGQCQKGVWKSNMMTLPLTTWWHYPLQWLLYDIAAIYLGILQFRFVSLENERFGYIFVVNNVFR